MEEVHININGFGEHKFKIWKKKRIKTKIGNLFRPSGTHTAKTVKVNKKNTATFSLAKLEIECTDIS